MEKNNHLEFRFGLVGKLIPLLTAVAIIFLAAMNQSDVNGYVVAFFMAIIVGILFVKDEKAYGHSCDADCGVFAVRRN